MGRGWFLIKCFSSEVDARKVYELVKSYGFNDVSVSRSGSSWCVSIGSESTKKVLEILGLKDKYYPEVCRPSIDELRKVLKEFVVKWHIHIEEGRNSRGYMYRSECILLSTRNSERAKTLAQKLRELGIRVRKVVWGTVIVCRAEDVNLIKKCLSN